MQEDVRLHPERSLPSPTSITPRMTLEQHHLVHGEFATHLNPKLFLFLSIVYFGNCAFFFSIKNSPLILIKARWEDVAYVCNSIELPHPGLQN